MAVVARGGVPAGCTTHVHDNELIVTSDEPRATEIPGRILLNLGTFLFSFLLNCIGVNII